MRDNSPGIKKSFLILLLVTALIGCSSGGQPARNFSDGVMHSSELVKRYGRIRSSKTELYLNTLLSRLRAGSPDPNIPLELVVLSSLEPAALSLSGGFIVVSKGIILAARTEAELAFVLAHEIGHQFITDSDPTETELLADRIAIQTISRSGYNPEQGLSALVTSYALIPDQGDGEGHPALSKRISALELMLKGSYSTGLGTSDTRAFHAFKREISVLN